MYDHRDQIIYVYPVNVFIIDSMISVGNIADEITSDLSGHLIPLIQIDLDDTHWIHCPVLVHITTCTSSYYYMY